MVRLQMNSDDVRSIKAKCNDLRVPFVARELFPVPIGHRPLVLKVLNNPGPNRPCSPLKQHEST